MDDLAKCTWEELRKMNHDARMALNWDREEAIHQELLKRHRAADKG